MKAAIVSGGSSTAFGVWPSGPLVGFSKHLCLHSLCAVAYI